MATESKQATGPDYPPTWYWDDDGDHLEGTFVRIGQGFTANGPRPFVTMLVDGTERTVWLLHEVLRNQFAREVQSRPKHAIKEGERIAIWKLAPKESGSGRMYENYRVQFLDAPELSQQDLLGVPSELATEPESTDGDGDDLPF